jgi:hypothetical protein
MTSYVQIHRCQRYSTPHSSRGSQVFWKTLHRGAVRLSDVTCTISESKATADAAAAAATRSSSPPSRTWPDCPAGVPWVGSSTVELRCSLVHYHTYPILASPCLALPCLAVPMRSLTQKYGYGYAPRTLPCSPDLTCPALVGPYTIHDMLSWNMEYIYHQHLLSLSSRDGDRSPV